MTGKCIVFYNLKPRPLAGVTSEGMVMCASDENHTNLDILRPEDNIPIGTRVNLLGEELELKEVGFINPKKLKKVLELLKTDSEGNSMFDGKLLSTEGV